jgi:hypothetical protein
MKSALLVADHKSTARHRILSGTITAHSARIALLDKDKCISPSLFPFRLPKSVGQFTLEYVYTDVR